MSNTNAVLREALKSLLDWAREHTSPQDQDSPHELLIKADAALVQAVQDDQKQAVPIDYAESIKDEALRGALPWLCLLGDYIGNGVKETDDKIGRSYRVQLTPLGPEGRCDAIGKIHEALAVKWPRFWVATYGEGGLNVDFFDDRFEYGRAVGIVETEHEHDSETNDSYTHGDIL